MQQLFFLTIFFKVTAWVGSLYSILQTKSYLFTDYFVQQYFNYWSELPMISHPVSWIFFEYSQQWTKCDGLDGNKTDCVVDKSEWIVPVYTFGDDSRDGK